MVEFKQIIGRGTRLYPDADKLTSRSSTTRAPPHSSRILTSTDRRSGLLTEEINDEGEVVEPLEVHEPEPDFERVEGELNEDELEEVRPGSFT